MQEINVHANPFPGLRPFESNETHLFFGRDGQSEELLRRLRRTRFLAVVGTSGSGKSSLVRAGLLPALQGGLMTSAGSDWRIAIMRPGSDPLGNLARSLSVLGSRDEKSNEEKDEKSAIMQAVLAETALRRSSLGLVELVSHARTKLDEHGQHLFPDYENLLVVVDQFEELFRFKQLIEEENSQEDAAAFVKLLLEAVKQPAGKIYIVLTMRSDFLGDCSQFGGLPEAINNGQYLIPRMTRDERREAIIGPVAVGEGAISEPLVNQLLNDVGDNPDQLPILQHALMRTWDYWLTQRRNGAPMDIPHYNAIGGMSEALSLHADEAYEELNDAQKLIAKKLFKGLTEKGTDNREIRRPMEVREICELTGASEEAVISVVEVFRRAGRSFLMPPPTDAQTGKPVPLNSESLIDISHESLIRNWGRLKEWVDEESRSARIYRRLAETAVLHKEEKAGLWGDPDLQIALTWRKESQPNKVWARRYHPEFPLAMDFLDQSVAARDAHLAAEEARRRKEIKRTRLTALIFAVAFLFSLAMGIFAYNKNRQTQQALNEATIAKGKVDTALIEVEHERAEAEEAKTQAIEDRKKAEEAEDKADARAKEAEQERQRAEAQTLLAHQSEKKAADEARKNARQREEAIDLAKQVIEKEEETRELIYSTTIGVAQEAIEDNNNERAQTLLQQLIPITGEGNVVEVAGERFARNTDDLRGFEWYYLWGIANRKLEHFYVGMGEAQPQADAIPDSISKENLLAVYSQRRITPVSFSNDVKEMFVVAGGDNSARLWLGFTPEPLAKLPPQSETIRAVASVGPYMIVTGDRTAIKIWTLPDPSTSTGNDNTLSLYRTLKLKGESQHIALDMTQSSNVMAIGSGATFMLWKASSVEPVMLAEGGAGFPSVAFIEKDKKLVTSDGWNLTRWDVETRKGAEIKLLDKSYQPLKDDEKPFIRSMAFTPGGKKMVTSSNMEFMIWTAADATGASYALKAEIPAHKENFSKRDFLKDLVVAMSPDGNLLATGDGTDLKNGGGVKVWDITGDLPKELFTLSPDVETATSLSFSADSRTLAVGGKYNVQLWDVSEQSPSKLANSYEIEKAPRAIKAGVSKNSALSPDGKLWATSFDFSKMYWQTDAEHSASPPPMKVVGTVTVESIIFSPDGKLLAMGGGGDEADFGVVRLWDVEKRQEIDGQRVGHEGVGVKVMALAFSPDSTILATGGTDKIIELWKINRGGPGHLLARLEGHRFPLTALAYSPDGKTLASGDASGTVNLWSIDSEQLMMTLQASENAIEALAFEASSNNYSNKYYENFYTRDAKGVIRLWPAAPREQAPEPRQAWQTPSIFPGLSRYSLSLYSLDFANP
jgi:WD40 repeat protein/energy-coupling factor transporter ATP-binding protein EcfA2